MAADGGTGGSDGDTGLAAYVIGSVVLWTVLFPAVDWIAGDLRSVPSSAAKGAAVGLAYGLLMHPFERWLRRRRRSR